jgi:hypothetical protein
MGARCDAAVPACAREWGREASGREEGKERADRCDGGYL